MRFLNWFGTPPTHRPHTASGHSKAWSHSVQSRLLTLTCVGWAVFAPSVPTAQLASHLGPANKIPPVEQAIQVTLAQVHKERIVLDVAALPSVYIYRDKFKVSVPRSAPLKLGAPKMPASEVVDDEAFGKVAVFQGLQEVSVPYQGKGQTTLTVDVLACHAGAKICYPPHRVTLPVDTHSAAANRERAPATMASNASVRRIPAASPLRGTVVVRTPAELDRALAAARGRPAMVDIWATWCTPCKQMEKTTFANPEVREVLAKNFTTIKVDVSTTGAESTALLKRFDLAGPPGFAFFDARGNERADARLSGYVSPESFLAHLRRLGN